jgi:ADP-ribose pyrophosphatase
MDHPPNHDPETASPAETRAPHYTDALRKEPWTVLSSTEHRLGARAVRVDEILSPDETRRLTWTYFGGRNAVMILALDDEENLLLVREYRHPLGREIFNIPAGGAGHCDTEDELLQHAAKELAEETCYQARDWTKIGQYHPVPAMTPVIFHVYMARGLEPVAEKGTGAEWCEVEEVVRVPFRELYRAAVDGEIEDGITLLTILWAAAKGAIRT